LVLSMAVVSVMSTTTSWKSPVAKSLSKKVSSDRLMTAAGPVV
jgi:hypothetical protein